MKMLSHIKFLFQVFTVLFVCLGLGSLGAWESGNVSFFAMISQLALFGGMAYACFRLSAFANRRRLMLRAKRGAYVCTHAIAHLARPAHSRAG